MVLAVENAHWDKYAKEETHEHEGLGLHSLLQIKREEDIREFLIHVWCVYRQRQTAVSSLWLGVRSFETFSFLGRRRLSSEKN